MHSHKLPQKIESKRPYITNNNHLPYKYMLKVIILGDYGVGKSTLVNNYCKDRESIVPSELQIIASSSEVDNQSKQKQIPTLSL